MRPKAPRRIVVDASIARAAGGSEAVHPLPRRCRDFLRTMFDAGHHADFSRPVSAEWKKHESSFARQWRFTMMARKRLALIDPREDVALRESVDGAAGSEKARRAMMKDLHLVEAARATDRTVASLDDTVRALFSAAATRVRDLRAIVWVNPGREDEGCEPWLRAGAPPDKHRQLASFDASD